MSKSNVELVIRARNEATQALRSISDALKTVLDDQRDLAVQAGSTESRIGELGRELQGLGQQLNALRGVEKLSRDLERTEGALRKQRAAAQEAQLEYVRLAKAVSDAERPTKRLQNQLASKQQRLERSREAVIQLERKLTDLNGQYRDSRDAVAGLAQGEGQLAQQTARASAEFTALQAQLRELRNSAKATKATDLTGLDVPSLTQATQALGEVERRLTEVGQQADLTQVDLAELDAELKSLEATGQAMGALKGLLEDFRQMRGQTLEAKRTWKELENQTKQLAQEFRAAAEPSRELAEGLGRARAASRQAKQAYLDSRNGVQQFSRALKTAGVDSRNLDSALRATEDGINRTAAVLAEGQVRLDRWGDAQKAQIEVQREAAAASEREAKARREAARQLYESQRVYRQTKAAVDEARQAYQQATEQVTRIAAAMRQAEQPSGALAQEFERAKKRAQELKASFVEVRDAYGMLGQNMAKNRQDAQAVAGAQQRLEQAMERSGQTMRRNGQAAAAAEQALQRLNQTGRQTRRVGDDVGEGTRRGAEGMRTLATDTRRADEAMRVFRDNGRTTLSLLQRIRGQVLALASAYVGLFGAIRGAQGVFETSIQLEATQARLGALYGDDLERIGEDLRMVRELSEQLGLSFKTTQESYAKFMIAATKAGASIPEAQAGFVSIARAARAAKLSDDQIKGTFMAVEQMYSKGQVMAEELRRQLGDRLPGAFSIFAKSIGVTTAELDNMLENGQVKSDALIHFFVQLEKEFEAGLPAAIKKTQAEMGRFQNAVTDLQLAAGESGFLAAMTEGFHDAAEFLSGGDAQEGARRIGSAIGGLVRNVVQLLDHLDELKLAFQLLGTAYGVKWAAQIAGGISGLITQMRTATAATNTGTAALRIFYGTLLGIGLLMAAWSIAEWAAKEFPAFGRFWYGFKSMLLMGLADLEFKFKATWVSIANSFKVNLSDAFAWFMRNFASDLGFIASLFEVVGDGPVSNLLRSLEAGAQDTAATLVTDATAARLAELEEEFNETVANIERRAREARARMDPNYTPPRDEGGRADVLSVSDFIDPDDLGGWFPDISTAMARVEQQLAEITATTLDARLALIRREFEGLLSDLQARGDEAGIAQVEKLIALRQEEERLRYAEEQRRAAEPARREAERMQGELKRVRRAIQELTADTLEERIALIRDEFADLYAYMERIGDRAALASIERLVELRGEQEAVRMEQERQQKISEEQRKLEQKVNDLFSLRRDLQEQINYLRQSGEPGADDAIDTLKERIEEINGRLEEAIDNALAFARSIGDENAIAALELMRYRIVEVQDQLISAEQVNRQFASGAARGFDQAASGVADFLRGLSNGAELLRNVRDAFLQFASDFLRQIAQMIIQQAIFNALQGASGGGIGGAIAGLFHTGGIVGTSQGGPGRHVPAAWFNNAVRYHTGGIAGLKPNEVPAILERGEEVLTKKDPRHSTNGGNGNQGDIKIINTLDAAEVVSAGLNTPAGERVILNVLSKNRRKVKQTLG
ncbi:tape measure protein [Billgrantia desiderata]|uniref:tape measure protein n=1 Tax=Billgrantia desiderata TaxID=52021 RepID=UPI001F1ECDC9|nr:tape measure protein [Halomonas desiderata]MCE8012895.1 tape measure protein [Halomonas desiderata]